MFYFLKTFLGNKSIDRVDEKTRLKDDIIHQSLYKMNPVVSPFDEYRSFIGWICKEREMIFKKNLSPIKERDRENILISRLLRQRMIRD